jgi:acyl-CoA dehydrogenase
MAEATLGASPSFDLDDDHLAFREVCRAFVTKELKPRVKEAEASGRFPVELWPKMAAAGLLGIAHPEEYGGTGGGALALTILSEELAKASGGLAVTPLVSSYMAGPHITHYGTPEQKERWLRPLLAGEVVAAIAVTEPAAGSDVAARTAPEGGHYGMTTFLVEAGAEGLTLSNPLEKLGWHASDTRELSFDDCAVSADAVLGAEGRGFQQIMEAFQIERISLAGMALGVGQAALGDAVAHAIDRQAFGVPIARHQTIRHRLAAAATELEAARALTYMAAARWDAGHPDAASSVAMAKLHAPQVAGRVVDEALQVFGGYGFMEETPVAMHYRDVRILRIGGGTDEIQLEILAKRMGL